MNLTRKLSWPFALVASIGLSATILVLEFSDQPCLFVWWYPFKTVLYLLLALWIFVFAIGGLKTRILIVLFLILPAIAVPNIESLPIAAAESKAVGSIRREQDRLQAYRLFHPEEGYPRTLPPFPEAEALKTGYSVHYSTSRSKSSGPIDRFVLALIPCGGTCGPRRSFTVTEDQLIRYTLSGSAATRQDPPLQ